MESGAPFDEPEDDEDGEDDDGLPVLDQCDGCGRVLEPGLFHGDDPLLSVITDPSAVDPADSRDDGRLIVMACSFECLRQIQERFGQRPVDQVEVWAGKIAQVIVEHLGQPPLPPEQLERETGLTRPQILAGFAWWQARDPGQHT